ncbi:MAG: HNH endonuclease [Rhodobacteraceae bacterium]|nr:HNH endonuclease [Paracoccaceae bacterium]
MGLKSYKRHSAKVTRTRRWKALRIQALDRDGWQCVKCPERRRLEVDHIRPVKTHPELSYTLANLQCLCGSCHAKKTRLEVGLAPLPPERQKWRDLLQNMQRKPNEQKENTCLNQ